MQEEWDLEEQVQEQEQHEEEEEEKVPISQEEEQPEAIPSNKGAKSKPNGRKKNPGTNSNNLTEQEEAYVKDLLERVISEAPPGENKKFTCTLDECDKIFSSKYCLKRHIISLHLGCKRHRCDICGKYFTQRQYLEEHTNTHTGIKPYVCEIKGCPKRFRQRSLLSLHRKADHDPADLEEAKRA